MCEFKTIREVVKTGLISEHYLRIMVKKGECPCIRSGNRVLVNYTALAEMLDRKSRGELKEGTTDD